MSPASNDYLISGLLRKVDDLERRVRYLEARDGPPVWTTFTPTLTQGVAVNVTVDKAYYWRLGGFVGCVIVMTATASGTNAQAITVGIPAAVPGPASTVATEPMGSGHILQHGVKYHVGSWHWLNATSLQMMQDQQDAPCGIDPGSGWQVTSGDIVYIAGFWKE